MSAGLPLGRLALSIPAGLALLVGLNSAPIMLGLPAPVSSERLPAVRGVLLVLGTLVALKHAFAPPLHWILPFGVPSL